MKLDKSYKVCVTPEQSREIQELLFALGGGWFGCPEQFNVQYTERPFFYVRSDGCIHANHSEKYFNYTCYSDCTEIQADDLIDLLTDLSKSDTEIDTMQNSVDVIDWSKAPKGYDWWAKDKDGVAYWFDDLPRKQGDCWGGPCNFETTTIYLNDKPWHESLERRPKSEQVPITGKLNTETIPIASTDDLHPEFEAAESKFKVDDKVYKYGETDVKTVLEVFEDGYMRISNYPYRVNHEVLCYATPENHAMLSKPYPHIEFEQPPKPLVGSDLARALIEKGWVGFNCLCGHSGDENAITDTIVTGINNDGKFTTIDGRLFSNAIPMKGWRPLKAQEVSL